MTQDTSTAGERTRARILGVALPLFSKQGYAGTGMRAIAEAAQVNVATLAWHFGDKDGLYAACVDAMYADLATAELPALDGPDPTLALVQAAWSFGRAHRDHVRLMHRHLLDAGALPEAVDGRWTGDLVTRAAGLFAALRPDMSEVDRRLLVFTMTHVVARFVLDVDHAHERATGATEDEVVAWMARVLRATLTS